ncbi:porin family protein [Aquimarina sp. RZ0]|uniref:porin family protein n=1 Tax=Aquimarina sp. RZ0 TaxID=2607730 RepID=UPI0011F0ADED|nr:porin family protein [Aquimarina sp. RZ0]KAA1244224.1 porin family protein [Aquimarina sp. RZ0]
MKRIIFILSLFLILSNQNFSQSKLQKAEKSLSKNSNGHSYTSQSRNSDYSSGDEYGILTELAVVFAEVLLYTTYYGMTETPAEYERRASNASITKYPYYNSKKGNYSYNWGEDTNIFRTTLTSRTIVENSKLYGNHLNADLRFLKRAGIEADYLQLWEDTTFFGDNSLSLFTLLAKYHRVRTEKFSAYWGVGAAFIAGEVDELGFTYGLGAEFFFAKPLSLESNFNQTFINTRSVNKFNLLLNYHMNRFKITGGYEHLKIGSIDFSTFSAGIGVSF